MIMSGGTGGHVFPGIALAKSLHKQGVQVVWLGTEGGMEQKWVKEAEIPFYKLTIKGLRGKGLIGWLTAPLNVAQAWWQARKIMQSIQPNLVLGMGGFVCGPGGLAAKWLGITLVLHEQNAVPGLTNRLLAPLAQQIITAFAQNKITGSKVLQLGNPVREGLEDLPLVSPQSPFRVLIIGGSRGALALNEQVPKAFALIPIHQRPKILHQTGEKTLQQALTSYQKAGVEAEVVAFIDDMVGAYKQADLVVCRAGALTVSELMATARPAIMIPFPFAVDDHQTANAKALVDIGGAEVLQQSILTPKILSQKLILWLDKNKLTAASENIRKKSLLQATEKITQVLLEKMQ